VLYICGQIDSGHAALAEAALDAVAVGEGGSETSGRISHGPQTYGPERDGARTPRVRRATGRPEPCDAIARDQDVWRPGATRLGRPERLIWAMADQLGDLRTALRDRFEIVREIGEGGMATVYLAHDVRHGRQVAVKVLRADLSSGMGAERFVREIRLAACLTHPHILPLFDSGEAGGFLYFVMPVVEGQSLRDRIRQAKQLPADEATQVAMEVADALDYAHRHDVVHRDIKPENIMLHDGHAVVTDFGIGKAITAAVESASALTQTGVTVGTPAYMAPEQAAGEEDIDGRSDLYSLGCVCYEMLTGEQPFTGATAGAVIAKRFSQTPRPVSDVRDGIPVSLSQIVARLLARAPADRYATGSHVVSALKSGATGAQALVDPDDNPIGVLPFANLSTDPENEFFADGITEEIINALSQLSELRVAARTSSFAFKDKRGDLADVASKLKVSYVVEGSVRKAGNSIRITAQLVSVHDGSNMWSEKYDRKMDDIFAVQDEIAAAIADRLKVALVERRSSSIGPTAHAQSRGIRAVPQGSGRALSAGSLVAGRETAVRAGAGVGSRLRAGDIGPV